MKLKNGVDLNDETKKVKKLLGEFAALTKQVDDIENKILRLRYISEKLEESVAREWEINLYAIQTGKDLHRRATLESQWRTHEEEVTEEDDLPLMDEGAEMDSYMERFHITRCEIEKDLKEVDDNYQELYQSLIRMEKEVWKV